MLNIFKGKMQEISVALFLMLNPSMLTSTFLRVSCQKDSESDLMNFNENAGCIVELLVIGISFDVMIIDKRKVDRNSSHSLT